MTSAKPQTLKLKVCFYYNRERVIKNEDSGVQRKSFHKNKAKKLESPFFFRGPKSMKMLYRVDTAFRFELEPPAPAPPPPPQQQQQHWSCIGQPRFQSPRSNKDVTSEATCVLVLSFQAVLHGFRAKCERGFSQNVRIRSNKRRLSSLQCGLLALLSLLAADFACKKGSWMKMVLW